MKTDEYYARSSKEGSGNTRWQLLEDHLREVADLAEQFALSCQWSQWAHAAGLWHDIGKYSEPFQRRLQGSNEKVDHSTAGAQSATRIFSQYSIREQWIGRILAYVIAGHHAGLPDGVSADESCLDMRLKKDIPPIPACPEGIYEKPNIDVNDLVSFLSGSKGEREVAFGASFFIRMLFSCLVDADRLNSESFACPQKTHLRENYPLLPELQKRLSIFLDHLARDSADTPVNRIRSDILAQCLRAAERPHGLFSLSVPTGGGKTLSSLAFALQHALQHGFKRIIYVIPFTSIIEQNAKVFRRCLGDDAVIEHHSNFAPPDDSEDADSAYSLAVENWDAPLIVTTNVQFFESLFSHNPSRCRKLHNIMDSVVILDEAQMLPPELLRPCLEAMRELTERYRTSIVLCTATQPALSERDRFRGGLKNVREIIESPQILYDRLRRTEVEHLGRMDNSAIHDAMFAHERVLCIVNTRKRAQELFDLFRGDKNTYHLSAMMCPEHRTCTLDVIRDALQRGMTCRVVSTQLVEAGVDLDFPVVFRETAGIDSIAQAAGRCNREGKLPHHGKVYVFESPDRVPFIFRQQVQATREVLRDFGNDVLSLDAVRKYFQVLYWQKGDAGLDARHILNRLTDGMDSMTFPFREIGELFRLIDEDSHPVIIPWRKEGEMLVQELRRGEVSRKLTRRAQRYTVSVYPKAFKSLVDAHAVEPIQKTYTVLTNMDLYHDTIGLVCNNSTESDTV